MGLSKYNSMWSLEQSKLAIHMKPNIIMYNFVSKV